MRYREIFGHLGFEVGIEMGRTNGEGGGCAHAALLAARAVYQRGRTAAALDLCQTRLCPGARRHHCLRRCGLHDHCPDRYRQDHHAFEDPGVPAPQQRPGGLPFRRHDHRVAERHGDDLSQTADDQLSHPAGGEYRHADFPGKSDFADPEPHPFHIRAGALPS